jgi:hypothetical protein
MNHSTISFIIFRLPLELMLWASSVWETLTLAKGVSLDPLQQRSIIEGIVHNIYFCRNNFLNCRINIVGFRNQ